MQFVENDGFNERLRVDPLICLPDIRILPLRFRPEQDGFYALHHFFGTKVDGIKSDRRPSLVSIILLNWQ